MSSTTGTLLTGRSLVAVVDLETEDRVPHVRTRATRDHGLVKEWARRRGAEPATGETTPSGDATIAVSDGDAGIRFNFPGFARYRPITWDEWFDNFKRYELMFVFEREDAGQPLSARYRLRPASELAATVQFV